MVSWFNNSDVISFLLAPISKLRFFRSTQRLRICEHCGKMGIDMHWSKTDYIVDGMTLDELRQFVYDDVYSSMLEEEELFHLNMEQLELELEDLGF